MLLLLLHCDRLFWDSCCHGFFATVTDYTLEQLSWLLNWDRLYSGTSVVIASLLWHSVPWNRCFHGFSTVTDCALEWVLLWFLHCDRMYPILWLASLFCQTVSWNSCYHDFSIVTDYILDLGVKRNFLLKWHFSRIFFFTTIWKVANHFKISTRPSH